MLVKNLRGLELMTLKGNFKMAIDKKQDGLILSTSATQIYICEMLRELQIMAKEADIDDLFYMLSAVLALAQEESALRA